MSICIIGLVRFVMNQICVLTELVICITVIYLYAFNPFVFKKFKKKLYFISGIKYFISCTEVN